MKKIIAKGIGYNHSGKSYQFPIYSKKDLEIIRKSGANIVKISK